ncbi:MAG: hypothetical protein J6Y28_04030 [Acholeplasmatales bacterium]|nr:hypothetical protein [Methanobrevibacter sp.]MBP5445321.1 hypothetical protein [Acholeplasmatales bacterium]
MKINDLKKVLENIHPGSFFRIKYSVEIPLKAEYRNMGYRIVKTVYTTSRTGVRYMKINGVTPSEKKSNKPSNWSWEKKNYISYNSNTGSYYLNLYPMGMNTYTKVEYKYYRNDDVVDVDNLSFYKDMIIPSYFKKDGGFGTKILKIKIDNIIELYQHPEVWRKKKAA